jgi:hypothetical protein
LKGNPLFKIVPEGMDEDGFAALGVDASDEDGEEMDDEMEEGDEEEDGDEEDEEGDVGE